MEESDGRERGGVRETGDRLGEILEGSMRRTDETKIVKQVKECEKQKDGKT